MKSHTYDHHTLLNGSPVIVEMEITTTTEWSGDTYTQFSLVAVYFDGVDVSPILDKPTLIALEMEGESAVTDTRSDIPSHLPTL
jgi:hypothetical protein